jgi:hypothetical protein
VTERSLSLKEVCERLKVGQKTALFWVASGQLIATNVARDPSAKRKTWRVPESALRQFELSRRAIKESPDVGRVYRSRKLQHVEDRY